MKGGLTALVGKERGTDKETDGREAAGDFVFLCFINLRNPEASHAPTLGVNEETRDRFFEQQGAPKDRKVTNPQPPFATSAQLFSLPLIPGRFGAVPSLSSSMLILPISSSHPPPLLLVASPFVLVIHLRGDSDDGLGGRGCGSLPREDARLLLLELSSA